MKLVVLLLVLLSHSTFSVKHSLKFIYIASSGVPNFPEFAAAAVVDETVASYCDTKLHLKEDWVKTVFDNNPDQVARFKYECLENQPFFFKSTLYSLMQRFNQSGGVQILQRVSGCEWDDETGEKNGFNSYGYNGEDFISFDLKTLTWVAPRPQAFSTKLLWETDKARKNYNVHHLTQLFPGWLKTYIDYAKSTLMRTDLPSVSLLQKSPSSPITCHATGFYPNRAVLFWRKDGEELLEDMEHGEILPNQDGSFQMSVELLKLPSKDWGKYECVFLLSGVKEEIITKLEKNVIRTNYKDPTGVDPVVILGLITIFVAVVAAVVGFMFYRRCKATETRTETLNHETTSMNSSSCKQQNEEEEALNTIT